MIVPLNWAFHSETGEVCDFGLERPETDLKRLVATAAQLEKEIHFFMPVGPAPFLPNGGVPHLLARQMALSPQGPCYAIYDGLYNIHKIYSFFDPRVYQGYSRFVRALGQYLSREGIMAMVWAVECGHLQNGQFLSFLEDRSKAYEAAFARYISVAKEGQPENLHPNDAQEHDVLGQESDFHQQFYKTIRDLYQETASRELAGHYEGLLRLSPLGSSQEDFFQRVCQFENVAKYSRDLLEGLVKGVIPSTVLLGGEVKKGIFKRQVEELVTSSMLPSMIHRQLGESGSNTFSPLVFFEFYYADDQKRSASNALDHWPTQVLEQYYRWTYRYRSKDQFYFDEYVEEDKRIHFLEGQHLEAKSFSSVLKIFMNGGNIILNRSNLALELNRKLETFFLENSLEVEKINIHQSKVMCATLGEGKLMLVEGDSLSSIDSELRHQFWIKVLSFYHLPHLGQIQGDEVHYFWRTRSSSPSELSYEEVRRLSLYNHSSYKKKVKIPLSKNFVLMKIIDETNSVVQSHPHEIDVQLKPEGAVSLDFGLFSN